MKVTYLPALILLGLPFLSAFAQAEAPSRMIVLTDIEADPDDTQSLVRLLLYSNEIEIKGLVATTSVWQKNRIATESIEAVIQAYAQIHPNLITHDAGYPEPEVLLATVTQGLPLYGMSGVGDGKNSPGSDWIISELEKDDARPLWISVWGGVNTLAQALHQIRATKPESVAKQLVAKLRVYTISDQDDSGAWIRKNFPELFYIVSPGDDYGSATWIAISQVVEGIDNQTISNPWLARNIQQGHGPLGAAYPDVSYGMEGDTPAWLGLIPNGINGPEHPEWGGWGGRYERYIPDFALTKKGSSDVQLEPETRPIWTNAIDHYTPHVLNEYGRNVRKGDTTYTDSKVTLWRWRDDIQNDFAARMDWCLKSYPEANHPPVPRLAHADHFTVKSGDYFRLDASGSSDPDGDNLSILWFNYAEAGSYSQEIAIGSAENARSVAVKAPEVEKPETAHFILKVTDKGSPALSRYKRVIVTIAPK